MGSGTLKGLALSLALLGSIATTGGEALAGSILDGCPALIIETFGEHAEMACGVSKCETRGNPWNVWATGAEGEMGWFQVHPKYHADATYDPFGNVRAAYRISHGGTDWRAWSCRAWWLYV